MAGKSLDLPYRRFLKSSAWLLAEFNRDLLALQAKKLPPSSFCLLPEMATLRLHDEWARCCREIVLCSAADEPKTANGNILAKAPNVNQRADAIAVSIRSTAQRRFEPRWATASESLAAAQSLRLSNLMTVSGALGAANSPAEDLRHVRNFFAHRAENTAAKVRARPFFTAGLELNAVGLLATGVPGGTSRFEFWVLGLRAIAAAAIQ